MSWESFGLVTFDLGPLRQGQMTGLGGVAVRVLASNV